MRKESTMHVSVTIFLTFIKQLLNQYVRSSHPEEFCKKGVLRYFSKFTGKHLVFSSKVAGRGLKFCLKRDPGTGLFR